MRLLAVNWRDINDPLGGGAELHLHEILKYCVDRGHEVDLVVSAYDGAPPEERLDGVRVLRKGHWALANMILPGLVRRLLRKRAYDLLIEDINKIPFYTPLYSGDTPVLAIVPHLFGSTVFREANPLVAAYVWGAERMIPRVYGRTPFEVISPSTRDDLAVRGLPAERIRTVYCGMQHDRFRVADPPPRDPAPLIISWSRLRRYKSVDVAIRAFARIREELPRARMKIMGRGPDEPRLRRLVREMGLRDEIEFTGHLAWSDLVDLLYRARIFLNPSPKEGWGLTVIEANACGLPVVASDRPGLRDSVRDGRTGLLTPYGDAEAMARAALDLLREPGRWESFSDAARAWSRGFTWERCGRQSLAIFEAAAAGTPLPETGELDP